MKKSFVKKYLWNKYGIIIGVVLLIIIYSVFFRNNNSAKMDYVTATVGNILEKVSVTGKISPTEKADLAFEKGGRVTVLNFKVGDRVKKGDIIASLDSASDRASLASAEAKLSDLSRSLNAPELALEQSKINTAKITLVNAKQDALNAVRTALTQTQSAVNNYADTFFNNPQSANPTINIQTQSFSFENSINSSRVLVSEALNKWKNDLSLATSSESASSLISNANVYEVTIKGFMDQLSSVVNDLDPGSSGLSRSAIDSYISTMNSGLSTLNQAISSISTTKTSLENALSNYDQIYNNFLLKNSGSSAQAIQAQLAVVDSYRAELAKGKVVSPITGIITKVEPDLGEFVSSGVISFGVISDGDYKIEAYVPEADIAKISIGNIASTTLDAYGQSVDFPSTVVAVDPAETVLEGVPTYRITLKFINKDVRIRSGMTANLDILTKQKNNVISVPARAIIDSDGVKSIRILKSDNKTFVTMPVVVGLKGSDGMVEIINGVSEGEKVVTYVK
ncbi:MAG: HlyD family efflux transporter periplasmic adaptor subunit [Candidatus Paceibacterota bacterium]